MPWALITGASSGIGEQFCHLFAVDGIDLAITSSPRSADLLSTLAQELRQRYSIAVEPISMDLATPDAAAELRARVHQGTDGGVVDFLVNNAAFGIVGIPLQRYDPADLTRMLQVNVMTLADLACAYAQEMVGRGAGRILNVSSVSGYVVPHGLECGYAASKAFVVSFSECLAQDLKGTGVTCTHLAPGPTRTNFFRAAGITNERWLRYMYMEPAPVAQAGYKAMMAGKPACIPGIGNKAMRLAAKLAPSRTVMARASGMMIRR
ncbi:MAG: SDR family NAD(P)-dependent oxidoreductase [Mycobacterium sp.]